MTKKLKIIIITISFLLIGITIYILCRQTYITSSVDTGIHLDQNNITEPVLQVGNYYLNGNTENCFFKVMPDNMIQLCGNDKELFDLLKHRYPYYDDTFDERKSEMEKELQYDVDFWKTPHEYIVHTRVYPQENITVVSVSRKDYPENNTDSSSINIGYIDSNTLDYYEKFVLINN